MKRWISSILLFLFILSLCSCGGASKQAGENSTASPTPTFEPTAEPTAEPTPEPVIVPTAYRVIVNDELGQPVEGVKVQFCSDTQCMLGTTDAEGIAVFSVPDGQYAIHILEAPWEYIADYSEYDAPKTRGDVIITLKTVKPVVAGTVIDFPKSGVVFSVGDFIQDLHGQILLYDKGETHYGSETICWTPYYLARSDAELAEYNDIIRRAETGSISDEDFDKANAFFKDAFFCELFSIVTYRKYDGRSDWAKQYLGKTDSDFEIEFSLPPRNSYYYLYLEPKAEILMANVPEGTPEEYIQEFTMLLKQGYYRFFGKNIEFKDPVRPLKPWEEWPNVAFVTKTLDGTITDSAEIFAGHKVTMINLWTTWCSPCKKELPDLQKLSREFEKQGCQIIGICCDAVDKDVMAEAAKILKKAGVTYTNYAAFDELEDIFIFRGYPSSFFVDSEGKILTLPVGLRKGGYRSRLKEALALID